MEILLVLSSSAGIVTEMLLVPVTVGVKAVKFTIALAPGARVAIVCTSAKLFDPVMFSVTGKAVMV